MVNILNMIKTYTFDTQEVIDSVPSATTTQEGLVYLAENIDDTRENAVVNVSTFKTAVKEIEKKVNEQCGPFLRTNADRSVFYGNLDGLVDVGINGLGVSGSNMTEWDIDVPNLINGDTLFRECTKLKKVVADFSSLENGSNAFRECSSLTSFDSSLSSLTDGSYMFQYCSSLTSFNGSLSSLTNGSSMFYGCKLDLASVKNIASTIKNLASSGKSGTLHLGYDTSLSDNSDLIAALTVIQNKGWTIN